MNGKKNIVFVNTLVAVDLHNVCRIIKEGSLLIDNGFSLVNDALDSTELPEIGQIGSGIYTCDIEYISTKSYEGDYDFDLEVKNIKKIEI